MNDQRYALTWAITGHGRGVFCPAGGMTKDEAERAKERLQARALANGIRPPTVPRQIAKLVITAKIVPYIFDIDNDPIAGLPSS